MLQIETVMKEMTRKSGGLSFSRFFQQVSVQTSKQRCKNLVVDRGPPGDGGPSHGTTGTMVNPAVGTLIAFTLHPVFATHTQAL